MQSLLKWPGWLPVSGEIRITSRRSGDEMLTLVASRSSLLGAGSGLVTGYVGGQVVESVRFDRRLWHGGQAKACMSRERASSVGIDDIMGRRGWGEFRRMMDRSGSGANRTRAPTSLLLNDNHSASRSCAHNRSSCDSLNHNQLTSSLPRKILSLLLSSARRIVLAIVLCTGKEFIISKNQHSRSSRHALVRYSVPSDGSKSRPSRKEEESTLTSRLPVHPLLLRRFSTGLAYC